MSPRDCKSPAEAVEARIPPPPTISRRGFVLSLLALGVAAKLPLPVGLDDPAKWNFDISGNNSSRQWFYWAIELDGAPALTYARAWEDAA